ncbi:sensor histidine kinase [Clostridium felsineum]|uniref:histidine kinase n=1 Tax=Clostridium felsineum TaxID=36839 RepID=A0A1S8LBC6_9CLOT|nr:HAMP domain-containing sensor histidine kinase [Clostridium felsineum]URZ00425.1 Adaptive-response sensory-kinase SasA [Clostridium felsineum]URZ06935.1 Adaptive-response sensory-kinase SasA [Clostridium felsineum]URZ11967.1 Adaptive-response sensory-kinase SasA [Clostridium felsineum]URZ16502.1 Adaptive-response sensory-kinase SasA [Clostridium felsineum DSM 794]
MRSIRREVSTILIICTMAGVILSAIFVNIAMKTTFDKYMIDIQKQRDIRIVSYFEEIYKRDKRWTQNSGSEMMHEAYMSDYCLTLLDGSKKVIWGMNPNDIKNSNHWIMKTENSGVYSSKTLPIKVNKRIVGYAVIGQYHAVILSEADINFKNSINQGIILSVFIAIVIVAILSLLVSKGVSFSIKKVSETSVQFSKGNYEFRSEVKSNIVEINDLIKSINMLGGTLKHQNLLRRRLVSDISHEIRTPLNVLQNNLEAMIDGVIPVTGERLNKLNEEVIRFGKLLNNLDLLKKFEAEQTSLNMDKLFLDDLVKIVCNEFNNIAKKRNIKIHLDVAKGDYSTLGDYNKLKQVFVNLLSNSVKFNKDKGDIWISLEENGDKVIFKIKDNGIGIKEEDVPYVFERLYRGDKSRHKALGNGIGLAIVKTILDLHSADINVESKEGYGSEFIVYFSKFKAGNS